MASTTRHFVRKSHTDDGDDADDDDDDDDDADAFLEVLVLFLSRMCHKDYKVSLVS